MASDGVRMRKHSNDSTKSTAETTEIYMKSLSESIPSLKVYITSSIPYVVQTATCCEATIPYLHAAFTSMQQLAVILEPYRLDLLAPAAIGLIMCFFGGSFMTLIAACEAYRMVGLASQMKLVKELWADFETFSAASRADDKLDLDGDGVADVLQVTPQQLMQRKVLLFVRTIDPRRLGDAVAGLQSGFLAVVATLKLEFARCITLGSALGQILQKPCDAFVQPVIEGLLPPDYKRWASPVLSGIIKSATITFAWFLQRIISAFHSAMRGGTMFSRNVLEYLDRMNYVHLRSEDTHADEIAGYAVAALGLWFQLSSGFTLPFPLNVLLLPFTLAEWWLMWMVNLK